MSSCYAWKCKCLPTGNPRPRWLAQSISCRVSNRRPTSEHAVDIDYAIANNLTSFISMQNHHLLVCREEEREMFPTLNHFGAGIIPWSWLARCLLSRPLKTDAVTTRANTDLCVSLNALRPLVVVT